MAEKELNKKFSVELVRQMITLATSGFGLVAALAVFVTFQLTKLLERLENK